MDEKPAIGFSRNRTVIGTGLAQTENVFLALAEKQLLSAELVNYAPGRGRNNALIVAPQKCSRAGLQGRVFLRIPMRKRTLVNYAISAPTGDELVNMQTHIVQATTNMAVAIIA